MNQASVNKQAETTPAHMPLDSALNDNQIPVEHKPVLPPSQSENSAMSPSTEKTSTVANEDFLQKYALLPMLDESQGNASPKPLNMLKDEGFQETQLNYNPNQLIGSVGNNFVGSRELRPAVGSARVVDPKLLVTLRNTRLILIYKGYHYRRYNCQGSKIKWHCVDYECCAYLYSCVNKITVIHSVHNHMGIIRKNTQNTVTRLPNPLDYCVTSYSNPNSPQNSATLGNSHRVLHFKNDYMSVPKDLQAKVTIQSIPSVSKPQVYYGGKLAQPATDQRECSNEFIPRACCTMSSSNTVSNSVLTANDILTGAYDSEDNNSLNKNYGSEVPYAAFQANNQENGCNILRRALCGFNQRNLQTALIPRATTTLQIKKLKTKRKKSNT